MLPKIEILAGIPKEGVLQNTEAFSDEALIVIQMRVFHIFDMQRPAQMAQFHRVVPVKASKINRFIAIHVLK